MSKEAWFCPACQKHHAPHVDTCPAVGAGKAPTVPFPPYFGPSNVCGKCGLKLDGMMSYCCPQPDCPCGMGPIMCAVGVAADPTVIVWS